MILAALLLLQANTDSLAAHVRQVADSYLAAYFERHPDEATAATRASTAWNTPAEQSGVLHTLADARAVFSSLTR